MFVLGVVIGGLSIPAVISAFSQGNPPRMAMILAMAGGGLVVAAMAQNPNGYSFETVPRVFGEVIREVVGG